MLHPSPTPIGGIPRLAPSDSAVDPRAAEHLLSVVQELSLVRDMPALIDVVRRAARTLTGADGATFVLRDEGNCFYVDEDAIGPLWKGKRFPLESCISGWVMTHRQAVAIPDIYEDARIPHDAYRPTFVRSLVMVPIRTLSPIGAIGNYWAERRQPRPDQIRLLQALADSASVAIENVQLLETLERRVAERTAQLEDANRELESFSYSVAHELKTPLNHILGFAQLVADHAAAPPQLKRPLANIQTGARTLDALINDLLASAQSSRKAVERVDVDLSAMAQAVWAELGAAAPERDVRFTCEDDLVVRGDESLLRVVLRNLLGNAWKYTRKTATPEVAFGAERIGAEQLGAELQYYVRDNGAGFDASSDRLFMPFSRFHSATDYHGSGVGLSTVRRIVQKHGGRVWAESAPGHGATFRFTLPG